jgi:hypothetical protein
MRKFTHKINPKPKIKWDSMWSPTSPFFHPLLIKVPAPENGQGVSQKPSRVPPFVKDFISKQLKHKFHAINTKFPDLVQIQAWTEFCSTRTIKNLKSIH